jgi:hypothetical protein
VSVDYMEEKGMAMAQAVKLCAAPAADRQEVARNVGTPK